MVVAIVLAVGRLKLSAGGQRGAPNLRVGWWSARAPPANAKHSASFRDPVVVRNAVARVNPVTAIEYDEFGYFQDNAAEFGIAYDGPPVVRREFVEVDPGRRLSALVWGEAPPEPHPMNLPRSHRNRTAPSPQPAAYR